VISSRLPKLRLNFLSQLVMSASWQLNLGGFSFSPIIEAAFSFSPSFSLGFSLRCTPENHLNGFQRFWHGVTPS